MRQRLFHLLDVFCVTLIFILIPTWLLAPAGTLISGVGARSCWQISVVITATTLTITLSSGWPIGPVGKHGFEFVIDKPMIAFAGSPGITYTGLAIPYWLLIPLLSIIPALALLRSHRIRRRHALNLCPNCGYDLRATPERCPECGTIPEPQPPTVGPS